MTGLARAARAWLPVAVSAGILALLLAREDIDLAGVGAALTPERAWILGPALLAYGAVSLALEACSLVRLAGASARLPLWTAARIKAASYLAYTVHYTIGVGALTYLLRNRVGLGIAQAAGLVILIATFDLGLTLGIAAAGAPALDAPAADLRAELVYLAAAGVLGGMAVLRAPFRLGPLERLRGLAVFAAARDTPPRRLAELGVLRLAFVGCFFGLATVALRAFGIAPPLPELCVNVALIALVAALPIAVAGLGTGQAAFVYVFRDYGSPDALLACSLVLSAGLISLRAGMGVAFAREYARDAIRAARGDAT